MHTHCRVCECKKHHVIKPPAAHWEKCELMLLVTLLEVQLVCSVVVHWGIVILTQGFVSMVIDSAAILTHRYAS